MARFTAENTLLAKEIIGRYPVAKSALIPLLHLSQQQEGSITEDGMEHIAELIGVTPAEVVGTCSFYEMFKREPVGEYLINVCTNISCQLLGGEELLHHVEETLGIHAGSSTPDGVFTLEDVECIAACTEAPCLQVNYRYFHKITHDEVDALITDLRAGKRAHEIPKHGTLSRVRQHIPPDRRAGAVAPTESVAPVWLNGPSTTATAVLETPEPGREPEADAPADDLAEHADTLIEHDESEATETGGEGATAEGSDAPDEAPTPPVPTDDGGDAS